MYHTRLPGLGTVQRCSDFGTDSPVVRVSVGRIGYLHSSWSNDAQEGESFGQRYSSPRKRTCQPDRGGWSRSHGRRPARRRSCCCTEDLRLASACLPFAPANFTRRKAVPSARLRLITARTFQVLTSFLSVRLDSDFKKRFDHPPIAIRGD